MKITRIQDMISLALLLTGGGISIVQAQQQSIPERVAALKTTVAASQMILRQYEWIETTAVSLVKSYVPPNPAKIQAAKDAGKVTIELLEPGKRVRLYFRDYEKQGDNFGVEVDLANNRPLGMKVSTFLDDATDAVTLDMRMGQLNDGTTYASDITLDAKAKKLAVNVQNNGYRKSNQ